MNRLAELYPKSRFAGIDLSREAIEIARVEASQKGIKNIEFFVRLRFGHGKHGTPFRCRAVGIGLLS